jgi:quinol monooxygenase YgiN
MPTTTLIAVEAAITVADASTRDEVVARSAPIQQATRDEEPGCLVYCFAADPVQPDLIQVYELWEDEASLQAHFAHPNYHSMREMLNGAGLASAVSRKFKIAAAAPVYGPDRTPSASFPDD